MTEMATSALIQSFGTPLGLINIPQWLVGSVVAVHGLTLRKRTKLCHCDYNIVEFSFL